MCIVVMTWLFYSWRQRSDQKRGVLPLGSGRLDRRERPSLFCGLPQPGTGTDTHTHTHTHSCLISIKFVKRIVNSAFFCVERFQEETRTFRVVLSTTASLRPSECSGQKDWTLTITSSTTLLEKVNAVGNSTVSRIYKRCTIHTLIQIILIVPSNVQELFKNTF